MTFGICSLSQLHIYQMSVDVRMRENNTGPLTRFLRPLRHSSSTQICLLEILTAPGEAGAQTIVFNYFLRGQIMYILVKVCSLKMDIVKSTDCDKSYCAVCFS